MRKLFVSGTGTGIGKTVSAAILCEALKADYWKPVQAGCLEPTDIHKVKELVSNKESRFHNETYRLTEPMSPHAAAAIDEVSIYVDHIKLPETDNTLVIEGAGGLMVPLNNTELVIDLIEHLDAELVLVSQNYLGSINHTILSLEQITNRGIKLTGIIFNGEPVSTTEDFILKYTGVKLLGRIPQVECVDRAFVSSVSASFTDI